MFMPWVSYNRGIFDCFLSGICLRLHVTEADRCLCLSLKSIEAISLLRVKMKSRHYSSSSHEQQQLFSLPFSNASFVVETSFTPLPLNFLRLPPQFLVQLLDSYEKLHLLAQIVL